MNTKKSFSIRPNGIGRRAYLAALMATAATLCLSFVGVGVVSAAETAGKTIVIGQSIPTLNNPWYVAFSQGSQDMAKALGVKLVLVTNPASAPFDPNAQINAIENLIAQRPNAIQIDPTSSDAINGAINEARKAGIPVVTDGINVSTEVDASVVADNKQGGELAGAYVSKVLGGTGNIAMLEGTPGRDIIAQRHQGFRSALAASGSVKIVAAQNANLDQALGQSVTENIFEAHPDLKAIWGASDSMALGAVEALKTRKLAGSIVIGGFDGTPQAFQNIKAGLMSFTIDQVPYEMGATSIALAYRIVTGKAPDRKTILQTTLVDKSNVGDYLDNVKAKQSAVLASVLKTYGLEAK